MRITEAQLRRIVREELESVTGDRMSILPPDVSPELFTKAFKMYYGSKEIQKIFVNHYDTKFDTGEYLRSLTRVDDYTGKNHLTQQEAEEALKLLEMCIKGEQYEFGYLEIVYSIRKLFNKTVDNALKDIYYTYFSPNINIGIITHILYSPASITTHTKISEIKNVFNAEDLQKQIDALESLKAFTEPKQLSRSTLLKLKRLAVDPQGVFQAAQLYEML
jgi:hypothetical protein